MSSREERVDNALQQLLERLVPAQTDSEDEAAADARWDGANELARHYLDRDPEAAIADDVNHAADLIREKLLRGRASAAKATTFANLYSRLLAQPVLGQKWAILYFLHQLTDGNTRIERLPKPRTTGAADSTSVSGMGGRAPEGENTEEEEAGVEEDEEQQAHRAASKQYHVNSPGFNDAFSRNGLSRLPNAEGPDSTRPPPVRDRKPEARPSKEKEREEAARSARLEQDVAAKSDEMEPAESALLRDLPFTLQGLASTTLPFSTTQSLKLPSTLPIPLISLLHTLAEPALLYRGLSEFVDSSEGGLVGQSLRSAIGLELRAYLSLVATLEAQIRRALAQIDDSLPNGGLGKAGVTLKRCVIWTREATMGLRLMSQIVDSSRGKKGGELISLVHNFSSSHGDPFVHTFAERLLNSITRPFYNMLRAWIYDGELEDPYLEFFVFENEEHEDSGATSVWEHKYRLKPAMIPSIITEAFADRVFLIGKSLNFIRHGCSDGAWVDSYSKSASRELSYTDTTLLSTSIDEAYKTVMARLIDLLETKFALFSHLEALKKFLLLGQGDFIALLMESLAANLDRPANSQYRHTLTAQLEHAIRHSNAQHSAPDTLRRLDARMLELSHGEIGWDVFTLEYRVDAPLDVLLTPWAAKQYLKAFNFLWRVKRVDFALATTWRRCMTGARGVLAAVHDTLGADWKTARAGLAAMLHFVAQLQNYIVLEVIEPGWAGLQRALRQPGATLDSLIAAHAAYLTALTRKGLLAGGGPADFTAQLHALLKLMLQYRDAVDGLYSASVAEFTRRQERAARVETRTKAGRWGVTEADGDDEAASSLSGEKAARRAARDRDADTPLPAPLPPSLGAVADGNVLAALRDRLRALERDFRARVCVLLGDLAYQPDVDMRFLGVVMNFNGFYTPVRRRRLKDSKAPVAGKGKERAHGAEGGA